MVKALMSADAVSKAAADRAFARLLSGGFVIRNNALLWGTVAPKRLSRRAVVGCQDLTGLEYLLNKIHVEDYCTARKPTVPRLLGFAIALIARVSLQTACDHDAVVRQIVSIDMEWPTCVYSFHRLRRGEIYMDEQVDNYAEPVMLIDVQGTQAG